MIDDKFWMREALLEAIKGRQKDEVPVGAIIVKDKQVVARACNQPISSCNPVAHAEILVLQLAAKAIGNYRLIDCDLYVTLEPCTMCAGAIIHSRVRRLIYGATEPKAGAVISNSSVLDQPWVNHRVDVVGGVLQDECSSMISNFFQNRRKQIRVQKGKPPFTSSE